MLVDGAIGAFQIKTSNLEIRAIGSWARQVYATGLGHLCCGGNQQSSVTEATKGSKYLGLVT